MKKLAIRIELDTQCATSSCDGYKEPYEIIIGDDDEASCLECFEYNEQYFKQYYEVPTDAEIRAALKASLKKQIEHYTEKLASAKAALQFQESLP